MTFYNCFLEGVWGYICEDDAIMGAIGDKKQGYYVLTIVQFGIVWYNRVSENVEKMIQLTSV